MGGLGIKASEALGEAESMKRKTPRLSEEKWSEPRKIKAANKTGWSYFGALVKTFHRELGQE
jgi:hypothetical protein